MQLLMTEQQIIEADFTFVNELFERGVRIVVAADGRIERVIRAADDAALRDQHKTTNRLLGQALLPGMVNVHSHAFQRALRGKGETFPQGAGNFWTWREEMYKVVDRADDDTIYTLSKRSFTEMRAAGITTVGEFHYVHHNARLEGYDLDAIVLRAAADAGIRIVLLNTYYNTGGVGKPLTGGQLRFRSHAVQPFMEQVDRLRGIVDGNLQRVAAVVHSVRAAGVDDMKAVQEESRRRGMVFHMHVEEQVKEIEDCVAAYGVTPMGLILRHLDVDDRFTAVHCTHTDRAELEAFIGSGGHICICPMSEANLGDGIADVPHMLAHGASICIGSDANSRICFTEEMRWLEYVQRLATRSRGVIVDHNGAVAEKLWSCATVNGATSLGIQAGAIEPGMFADFVAIDLGAPAMGGWQAESILDAFVLGTGNDAIAASCVGGKWMKHRA
jgi:formimidoylglutamate deiminase